ncbi:MAG: spherulation-specific family 4 protein [Armatimonadetes bacterium]|nr:spherulation-specific family 4 protein [Armatimonadota bacterium]
MQHKTLLRIATAAALSALAAFSFPAWAQKSAKPTPTAKPVKQGMVVPAYFGPGELWTKMADATSDASIVAIMNPGSGPGSAARPDYVTQIKAAQAAGVSVIGYVHTSYGKRPIAEVQAEIKQYYQWYAVNGIFFDEVGNDDKTLAYYAKCQRIVRATDPKALVIINPGTPVTEGYMKVADIVVTFESGYDAYVKRAADPVWVSRYPAKRFWHLIYAAPDEKALQNAVRLSKQRNAGWLYVTPDTLPNPWDTLPEGAYWTAHLSGLAAPKR